MTSERGVGPVLGVILITGIVVAVAVTLAFFGSALLEDGQSDIEQAQTETAFSQLSVGASELREDGDEVAFDLGHRDGQVRTIDDTGELEVRLNRTTNTDVIYNTTLRSLVYERDGEQVAYQGGGVFRKHGGGSSVVSAPEFFYRENSMVFPITILEGDVRKTGQLDGTLRLNETRRVFPTASPNRTNPLTEGTVYIRLESEYCRGWQQYFDSQTRGSIVETCSQTGDTVEGEVKVEVSVPFEIDQGTFSHAVQAGSLDEQGGINVSDTQEGDLDVQSSDTLIGMKRSECKSKNASEWGLNGTVENGGLHCVDELEDDDHTFDMSEVDEDVEVYVDGNVTPEDDGLIVDDAGSAHNVSLFINENFDMTNSKNSTVVGNENKPAQTTIFVSSDGYVFEEYDGSNTAGKVYAAVYAPDSEGRIHANGNFYFEGSMIVGDMKLQGGIDDSDIVMDPATQNITMEYEGAGPRFYYLHLVEKRMEVRG